MKIVCIGDSIAAGQHLPARAAWPYLLGSEHTVYARGVNGDTSRLMLERFPRDVQQYAPDMVVIQCGHNDCNRWKTDRGLPRVSLRAYQANLHEMFDRCRTFDAIPILVDMIQTYKGHTYERDAEDYRHAARVIARSRSVELVIPNSLPQQLQPDGIHLTANGQMEYADAVRDALVRLQVAA